MKEANVGGDSPNPVDQHVGLRIRLRRRELGMTQTELAEAIGLTFQQVQKYERAANRVSASKLWELARAMQTTVAYFYEGLRLDGEAVVGAAPDEFMLSSEGVELARDFPRIADPDVRRRLLELVRSIASETGPG